MGGQVVGSPNLAPNSIPMVRVDLDVHQIVGWSLFWSSPARRSLVTLGLTSYTSSNGHLLFLPQSALLIGGCPIAILAMAKCWAHVAKRFFFPKQGDADFHLFWLILVLIFSSHRYYFHFHFFFPHGGEKSNKCSLCDYASSRADHFRWFRLIDGWFWQLAIEANSCSNLNFIFCHLKDFWVTLWQIVFFKLQS